MKFRMWLAKLLTCKHRNIGYRFAGGKGCPYKQTECECNCSIPVYDIECLDCGKTWTLGEDEVIDFRMIRLPDIGKE